MWKYENKNNFNILYGKKVLIYKRKKFHCSCFFIIWKKVENIIKENYGGPLKSFQTQYKFGKLKKN
jgi:hypothetical protein